MRYVDYLDKVVIETKKGRGVYWPKILPRLKFRITGDIWRPFERSNRSLTKPPQRFNPALMVWKVELWFSIPLRSRYVERYALEHLATYKGHAKRRLLVCWDYTPFRGLRLQWQEKFKPVEGQWYDDYPFQRKKNAPENQGTQGSSEEGEGKEVSGESKTAP